MSAKKLLSAFAIGTGMLLTGASLAPAFAQTASTAATTQTAPAAPVLTIKQIYDKLEAAGYTDITEIERDRNVYEAKARNKEGQRTKIDLDLSTGDIIKTKIK
ncbi:PepSY domain-containing protein [Alcaligenaceae bacterium]|nr:PepSY domain-containing protein [Alcaligenaceae bacterium]